MPEIDKQHLNASGTPFILLYLMFQYIWFFQYQNSKFLLTLSETYQNFLSPSCYQIIFKMDNHRFLKSQFFAYVAFVQLILQLVHCQNFCDCQNVGFRIFTNLKWHGSYGSTLNSVRTSYCTSYTSHSDFTVNLSFLQVML